MERRSQPHPASALQSRQKPIDVSRQGWLWRRGEVLGGWKKRWVVLVGDHLYGFNNRHEFVALAKSDFSMDIHGAAVSCEQPTIPPRGEGSASHHESEDEARELFSFTVTTATLEVTQELAAASAEDRMEWMEAIAKQSECPRWIKLSGSLCEGYLVKKGQKVRNWKRRYFVLLDSHLYYFRLKIHTEPAGVIPLRGSCILQNASALCRKSKYSFGITPRGSKRTYVIYATSDGDRHRWLDAIIPCTFDTDSLTVVDQVSPQPGANPAREDNDDDGIEGVEKEVSMEAMMARFDRKALVDLRKNASGRHLLLEGAVKCLQAETIFDRRLFLFNDVIVLAEQEDVDDSSRFRQREVFWLVETSISVIPREGFVKHTFDLVSDAISVTIGTSSSSQCARWVQLIFKYALQCRPRAQRESTGARHTVFRGTLHSAALLGDLDALSRLKENQDLDGTDEDGYTPLHLACHANQSLAIIQLLQYGASPLSIRDDCTPLHLACRRGHVEAVRSLCNNLGDAATIRETLCTGKPSPLWTAIFECEDDSRGLLCAKVLVEAGCDADQLNNQSGMSPLHHAVNEGDLARSRALVQEIGASISARSLDGKTALFYAVVRSNVSLVRFLLQCGSQPNVRDKGGNVPLHFASSAPVLLMLLEHGARMGLENNKHEAAGTSSHRDAHTKRLIRERVLRFARAPVPLVRRDANEIGGDVQSDWVPDSTSEECLICKAPFSMFSRRHHCRNCGMLVCNACSTKQCRFEPKVGKPGNGSTLRVCDGCFNRLSSEGLGTISLKADDNEQERVPKTKTAFKIDGKVDAAGQPEHKMLSRAMAVNEKAKHVADKSEILASGAADFAELAKQLANKYK